jgi:predicted HicB family RNase H-like nuclease
MNKQSKKTKLIRLDSRLHKTLKLKAARDGTSIKTCIENAFKRVHVSHNNNLFDDKEVTK